jgi:hypothetical protein
MIATQNAFKSLFVVFGAHLRLMCIRIGKNRKYNKRKSEHVRVLYKESVRYYINTEKEEALCVSWCLPETKPNCVKGV